MGRRPLAAVYGIQRRPLVSGHYRQQHLGPSNGEKSLPTFACIVASRV